MMKKILENSDCNNFANESPVNVKLEAIDEG